MMWRFSSTSFHCELVSGTYAALTIRSITTRLLTARVVDHLAWVIEQHRGATRRIIGRPCGQFAFFGIGIAAGRKRNPSVAHTGRQGDGFRAGAAGQTRRNLDVVEYERQFQGMRALQSATQSGRFPIETISIRWRFAKSCPALRDVIAKDRGRIVGPDEE